MFPGIQKSNRTPASITFILSVRSPAVPLSGTSTAGYSEVNTGESNGNAWHQVRFTPGGVAWIVKRFSKATLEICGALPVDSILDGCKQRC